MKYFVKTPWWLKKMYPGRVWDIQTNEKNIYLTFDDGPHPVATPFVLDVLKAYQAKASFFCIGKNVKAFPEIYKRILAEGHNTGNHTYHHLNGWKTRNDVYLDDVRLADGLIQSGLFRPPYGRLRSSQAKRIPQVTNNNSTKTIMWDVLSGDFDQNLSKEDCLKNVLGNAKAGSIIVFHDSEKAFPRLQYALPQLLREFSEQGFRFKEL